MNLETKTFNAERRLAVLGLLALAGCGPEPLPRPPGLRPNVLLVVADTLRRDHLSTHGYSRSASPRIDAFAASAVIFERAYAQSPSTKPSMASLFTSILPNRHGAILNEHALAERFVTLAETLEAAGYTTAGFTENPMVGPEFHFDQGFRDYEVYDERHGASDEAADDFDEAVRDWLGDNAQREFLLYVHYIDPHSPYWPPEAYRGRFAKTPGPAGKGLDVESSSVGDIAEALAKYDEEILYIDDRFGGLLDRLEVLGIRDETIIVFLSDHGEAFGEHGDFHHSRSVYAELIDIPLFISANEQMKAGRRSEPVQHIDLFPTLLDLTGTPKPALGPDGGRDFQGESLVDSNRANLAAREIISEQLREGRGKRMRSVVFGNRKLVEHLDSGRLELFDLESDRIDSVNRLDASPPEVRDRLTAILRAFDPVYPVAAAPEVEIDANVEGALRRLGYIPDDDGESGGAEAPAP